MRCCGTSHLVWLNPYAYARREAANAEDERGARSWVVRALLFGRLLRSNQLVRWLAERESRIARRISDHGVVKRLSCLTLRTGHLVTCKSRIMYGERAIWKNIGILAR
jgi:hypothetical protein